MKYEKTQKGNPHQLTINQHLFPARSIKRFINANQRVEVCLLDKGKNFEVTPFDRIFCARRAWDQQAESGFMKEIEDEYQLLADSVETGETATLNEKHQLTVSRMFALWKTRWHWANNPVENQQAKGVAGVEIKFSKDEQEQLEKAGITVVRPDLTISGRFFTGMSIQFSIDVAIEQLSDARWGILTCNDGEFLVPDTAATLGYVPLSPSKCFFLQGKDGGISREELDSINREVIYGASKYYFGRKL